MRLRRYSKNFPSSSTEVEDMIQRRLEEMQWIEERWRSNEGLWPQEFCLGDYAMGLSLECENGSQGGLGQVAETSRVLKKEDQG